MAKKQRMEWSGGTCFSSVCLLASDGVDCPGVRMLGKSTLYLANGVYSLKKGKQSNFIDTQTLWYSIGHRAPGNVVTCHTENTNKQKSYLYGLC